MQAPRGDFSDLKQTGSADVIQIISPVTLQINDGRVIRLAGLDFPDLGIHEAGDFSLLAVDILKDLLLKQTVNIYQTPQKDLGRLNRMGHHIAHLEREDDKLWVQGLLLSLGLSRVMTARRNPEMAAQMYGFEAEARTEKLGIWGTDQYKILSPEKAENHMNSFQIVEGRVQSAALNNNRVYLNFGPDWRTDFTVSIAPGDKRRFLKKGLDPLSWNGKIIRARGWVRSYNGPYMEIDHPEAIEFPARETGERLSGKD